MVAAQQQQQQPVLLQWKTEQVANFYLLRDKRRWMVQFNGCNTSKRRTTCAITLKERIGTDQGWDILRNPNFRIVLSSTSGYPDSIGIAEINYFKHIFGIFLDYFVFFLHSDISEVSIIGKNAYLVVKMRHWNFIRLMSNENFSNFIKFMLF